MFKGLKPCQNIAPNVATMRRVEEARNADPNAPDPADSQTSKRAKRGSGTPGGALSGQRTRSSGGGMADTVSSLQAMFQQMRQERVQAEARRQEADAKREEQQQKFKNDLVSVLAQLVNKL